MKEQEKLSEELYSLNSKISLRFIGLEMIPTYEEMCQINKALSKTIKKLRELNE